MKTAQIKLYRFTELDDEIRAKIVKEKQFEIGDDIMTFNSDEYRETLKEFEEIADIKVYNWEVGYCGFNFDFKFKHDNFCMGRFDDMDADDICGKYLRRWINHNLLPHILLRKKYYSPKAGWNREKQRWNKQYYSRITFTDWSDCPLTGCCYDCDILEPIRKCLSKPIPNDYSLRDLMYDALWNFFKAWKSEYEYYCDNTDNCIEDELINRYDDEWFYADGTMFVGQLEEVIAE